MLMSYSRNYFLIFWGAVPILRNVCGIQEYAALFQGSEMLAVAHFSNLILAEAVYSYQWPNG